MTSEHSDNLATRLEVFALQNPRSYRTRVALLAALGYAYVFLVLAAVLVPLIGMVAQVPER